MQENDEHLQNCLMTVKTASGIKKFQNQKELGQWFNRLLKLMKSRATCQPGQAIEPGSTQLKNKDVENGSMEENSPELASSSPAEQLERNEAIVPENLSDENLFERPSSARPKKSPFVLTKERKAPKSKDSAQTEEFSGLLGQIKTVLEGENNSVQQILSFLEKENEKARHELWLFQMMFPQQTSIPKSTCNIQIQPAPQTAVSSSPAQAEHLHNILSPNTLQFQK